MVELNHGQLLDLERQDRREVRLAHRKPVAVHVRVEFTFNKGGQFPIINHRPAMASRNRTPTVRANHLRNT